MSATAMIADLVLGVIEKLRGKSDDVTARSVADAVAEKVKESLLAAVAVELQKHANALGLVLATHQLADAALEVMQAMHKAETSPTLPRILDGVQLELMPPDWTPPPDESSER